MERLLTCYFLVTLFAAPLQRLFGEVARRSSSAIYTPGRSAIAAAPQPAAPPAPANEPTSALTFKARFVNRAAAVKRFMGGAAIAGVPRTLDAAYTEREDLVPITEGKYGKAFDMELLESLTAPPKAPVIPASILDMVEEEELEVWELKTAGKISAGAPSETSVDVKAPVNNAMRRRSLLRGAEEVVEPVVPTRLPPAVPTKSALRSRSSSPSATRRPSSGSASVRFDERKQEPPAPPAVKVDTPYTHPDLEFFDINSFPTEKAPDSPRAPSSGGGGFVEAKTSGVFLNKYSGEEDSDEEGGEEEEDSRVLYKEGGEFTQSCIKAAVEEMFSLRSYVSPLKAAQRPPPPPPPPSDGNNGPRVDSKGDEVAGVNEDGNSAQDDAEEHDSDAAEYPDRPSDVTEPEEAAWGKNMGSSAPPPATSAYATNSFLMAEASSDEDEELPPPAAAAPTGPPSLKERIAALNQGNSKQHSANSGAARTFTVAAKSPQKAETAATTSVQEASQSPPAPAPPSVAPPSEVVGKRSAAPASSAATTKPAAATGLLPSRTVPVARFAAPTFPTLQPLPAMIEFEASLTAEQFLGDTTKTIASAVNRIQGFAELKSVKVPAKSPLVSDLANATVNRSVLTSGAQSSGQGQLDAFEQLMLERKAVAEALVRLQEIEEASLKKIRDAEAAFLLRVRSEAEESILQVKRAEQLLQSKVLTHVERVKHESSLLSNYRRDLYAKQVETAKIQEQRFEQVAEMATTLAEQQLHIAAERRRVTQRQFQLQLSLIDLSQVEASRSKPSSPVRGPVGATANARSYNGMHNAPFSPHGQEIPLGAWGELGLPAHAHAHAASTRATGAYPSSDHEYHRDFPVGPSRSSAAPQPNPLHNQGSPTVVQQAAGGSAKSDSPPFEKLPPDWHSPVVPLVARRESAQAFPPTHGAGSPPPPPPSSSLPPGEQGPAPLYPQTQHRVVSPNADSYDSRVFGYTSTQYPNAVKNASDPNWRRPFR
jgi:hypothetical protein